MKLYFSKGACSLATRIIIYEIGANCQFESVDLASKQTKHGLNFLQINPKGSVPALLLDDGHILTENAVILQYLAEKYRATELLPTTGNFERYRVLECLNYNSTDLHKSFSPLFNSKIPQSVKEEVFKPLLKAKLDYIEQSLAESSYLVGDRFTLPDAYLFVMLRWLGHVGLTLTYWKNLSKYYALIKDRPSVIQALQDDEQQS